MAIILFDFDGVLADTLEDTLNFAREACAQVGFACDPSPADLEALDTMSVPDFGRQLAVPPEHIDEFVDRYLQLFKQKSAPPKIFPGMAKVITEAATHNVLAIITGNTTPTVQAFLREHGLRMYFRLVIGVERKGSRPEKIRIVLREVGHRLEPAYMVGDALSDIRAAREAGIRSIAVGWGHQGLSRLKMANPDYLAHSPQELSELLKMIQLYQA